MSTDVADVNDMSDERLYEEFREKLELYKKFRLDGPPVRHEHFDMHEETVLTRDALHEVLQELNKRKLKIDLGELRRVDNEWQEFIANNKSNDFELVDINRSGVSRTFWWIWIDKLEELTDEEKKTV